MKRIFRAFLCLLLSLPAFSQVNLSNGLVAFYPFNGNANDASGNGHHGQEMNGIGLTTDRFGKAASAYLFDGVDDYIKVPDNGAFSSPQFSLVVWFQTTSDAFQNLVAKRDFFAGGTGGAQYQFFINYEPFPGIGSNIVGNNSTCTDIPNSSYINTVDWICRNKWHCGVITFDGSRHKIYIDGVLKREEATSFTALLSCTSDIRFGNWWQSDLRPFIGKMDDIRWYDRALNQQEAIALYDNYSSTENLVDFTFSQYMCQPNSINFLLLKEKLPANELTHFSWEFGDGNRIDDHPAPNNTYVNYSTYTVRLNLEYKGGCKDSIVKKIPILNEPGALIGSDTTLCKGENLVLSPPYNVFNFCWKDEMGRYMLYVSQSNFNQPTFYTFTAQKMGKNLVVNGDFSKGNMDFQSDYHYNPSDGKVENTYTVDSNIKKWNPLFDACTDSTGSGGNMLLVNGSKKGVAIAWSQTIAVEPNVNYGFSAIIQNLAIGSPANSRLLINGVPIGGAGTSIWQSCAKQRATHVWNSGNNTSAKLEIENGPWLDSTGNNFSLDDIFFGELTTLTDTVKITVAEKPALSIHRDTAICSGASIMLNTQGSDAVQYSWLPSTGLSNPNIANPVAQPTSTTKYVVTAIGAGGCNAKDSVVVSVLSPLQCNAATSVIGFITPDTVCVNKPVIINNTSTGTSNYYWNFCVANSSTDPVGTNLGGFGFSKSVFIDYGKDGNNYYAFVTSNYPGKLTRLDFGNSLLNTPTAHDFGNLGGVVPDFCEGIQLVKNEGHWYAIIVGDKPVGRIVKVDFGASLSNDLPVATSWGDVGGLSYPTDLHLFQNGAEWYGLTINAMTSTITRFNFSSSFTNMPTGQNLGNIGGLNYPTGIYAITKDGKWYAFVSNMGGETNNLSSSSLTRLDFGNSLLNTPTGVNLGNPGNALLSARDLTIYQSCNEIFGFAVNYADANDIVRLNFNNSLTSVPTGVSIGNTGNLSFPHCISKLFRVDNDLYSFVANVDNNTITRLKFSGCNGASIASSTDQNPAAVTYNLPGTYNINLTADDGLPTQASVCKQVVVLANPVVKTRVDTTICPGDVVQLTTSVFTGSKISWSPATGLSDPTTASPIATPSATTKYIVTATNAASCSIQDSVLITVKTPQQCIPVAPGFATPDTVCVNTPITIKNTSTGASSYYWNFCVADLNTTPIGQNIGSPDNRLSLPVFMDYIFANGNYYGFAINHYPGALIRLDFGNSLLNTPTAVNLGNYNNFIPPGYGAEGLQVVQNEGRWYVIVVGGYEPSGSTPRLVTIDFGTDPTAPAQAFSNWGNIGNMSQPIDLHVFKEGTNWYGFTVNAENNTITRFNFTNSFSNTPTAVNLGNIGNLAYPTGIYAINDNGFWRVFITNSGDETRNIPSSLTRLDFGSSLLNTPVAVNLGNPGNVLKYPRDLTIMKQCGQIVGFAVNAKPYNDVVKMDFGNDLSSTPSMISLGGLGNTAFPHSISKLFRVADDVYGFVTNVENNTITRLKFSGCTAASQPSSTQKDPGSVTYNKSGVYNINLTVDDGLPTQASVCKQVVVLPSVHTPLQRKTICEGDSVLLSSSSASSNQWSNGSKATSIYAKTAGTYWVQSLNAAGCINIDSFEVAAKPLPVVKLGKDTSLCANEKLLLDAGNAGASYLWQNGQTAQTILASQPGMYSVAVTKNGCVAKDTISLAELPLPMVKIAGETTICEDGKTTLSASGGAIYAWTPTAGLSNPTGAATTAGPANTTVYFLTATAANGCKAKDSVTITVTPKPVFAATSSTHILCAGDTATFYASGGDFYTWSPAATVSASSGATTLAYPTVTTLYKVVIEDFDCKIKDSLFINLPVANKPSVTTTKSNDINCFIGHATLQTGGGSQYLWRPSTGLSDSTSSHPIVRINTTTTYHLFVTTNDGCLVEDSITVNVVTGDDGSGFPVANAFTPNNDGKNDCFGVKHWGDVSNFSMNLYNRWGDVVFHTEDPTQCWDGKYKGQLQPGDVYVYWIRAKTRCGDVFRKGTFTLIR